MNARRERLSVRQLAAAGVAVLLLVGGAVATAWASRTASGAPDRWLTTLGVCLALLAFAATALAALFTWPAYAKWREEQLRRPDIRIWLEQAAHPTLVPDRVGQGPIMLSSQGTIVIKVVIENSGNAPLRDGRLNIAVPTLCDIQPLDPPQRGHYRAVMPSISDAALTERIGTPTPVYFTVATGEFSNGHHTYHVSIQPLQRSKGPWYLKVELTGDPPPDPNRTLLIRQICREPIEESRGLPAD